MKRIVFLVIILSLFSCCSTEPESDHINKLRNRRFHHAVVDSAPNVSDSNNTYDAFKSHFIDSTNEICLDSVMVQVWKLRTSLEEAQTKNKEQEEPAIRKFLYLVLFLIVVLFILFIIERKKLNTKKDEIERALKDEVIILVKNDEGFRNAVIKIVQGSQRLREWRDSDVVKSTAQSTMHGANSYDTDINDLRQRVEALEELNKRIVEMPQFEEDNSTVEAESVTSKENEILYADFIDEGYFSKVKETPDDDTNFELHLNDKNTASFVVYLPAYPRILRNSAAFLKGCDKQGKGTTSLSVRNPGKAIKDGDGRWKVDGKIKVSIE